MEQSRERSSPIPLHLVVVTIEKGTFGSPSTTVTCFTYFIYRCVCVCVTKIMVLQLLLFLLLLLMMIAMIKIKIWCTSQWERYFQHTIWSHQSAIAQNDNLLNYSKVQWLFDLVSVTLESFSVHWVKDVPHLEKWPYFFYCFSRVTPWNITSEDCLSFEVSDHSYQMYYTCETQN